jgi:hypothetical protein
MFNHPNYNDLQGVLSVPSPLTTAFNSEGFLTDSIFHNFDQSPLDCLKESVSVWQPGDLLALNDPEDNDVVKFLDEKNIVYLLFKPFAPAAPESGQPLKLLSTKMQNGTEIEFHPSPSNPQEIVVVWRDEYVSDLKDKTKTGKKVKSFTLTARAGTLSPPQMVESFFKLFKFGTDLRTFSTFTRLNKLSDLQKAQEQFFISLLAYQCFNYIRSQLSAKGMWFGWTEVKKILESHLMVSVPGQGRREGQLVRKACKLPENVEQLNYALNLFGNPKAVKLKKTSITDPASQDPSPVRKKFSRPVPVTKLFGL